jgi:hypothetical protein
MIYNLHLCLEQERIPLETNQDMPMPMKMVYWGNKARGFLPAVIAAYGSLLLGRAMSSHNLS